MCLQVDAVVESEDGSMTTIELMNKAKKPSVVEPLLLRLQQNKWIVCVSKAVYSPVSTFPDIIDCKK